MSASSPEPVSAQLSRATLPVYVGGIFVMTGVQLIGPALPAIQAEFGFTDTSISLVSSIFLLPSIVSAIIAGKLANRIGPRLSYVGFLLLFGLAAPLQMLDLSRELFLVVRGVQGFAFGGVLPLSIIALGEIVRQNEQLRAQGIRNISMSLGDSFLPLVGGAILALGPWRWMVVAQMLTLALGYLALRHIPDANRRAPHGTGAAVRKPTVKPDRRVVFGKASIALQLSGFLRFLFKFGLAAYVPVLFARNGVSVTIIGLSLSLAAVMSIVVYVVAVRINALRAAWLWNLSSLAGSGVCYFALWVTDSLSVHLVALMIFGACDGISGLVQNTLLVTGFDGKERAMVTGYASTARNVGKAVAPILFGIFIAATDLHAAFLIMALVALAAAPTSLSLRAVERD